MRSKYLLPLAFVLAASACGDDSSDDTVGDGGPRDGGNRDASTSVSDGGLDSGQSGSLQPGTYSFSNITKITDGCELALEDPQFPPDPIPLLNTGIMISLGTLRSSTTNPSFTPSGYALGSGPYATSTTANLTVSARSEDQDGCDFNVQRTTNITYTGNNTISVDYTNHETNHTTECDAPTDDCTSHYTFTLTRTGP